MTPPTPRRASPDPVGTVAEALLAVRLAIGTNSWSLPGLSPALDALILAVVDECAAKEGVGMQHEPTWLWQAGKKVGWCCWPHMLRARYELRVARVPTESGQEAKA